MNLHRNGSGDMDWIDLAQDKDSRWALLNAVMNLQIALNAGNFLKCEELLDTHEGLRSVQSVI